MTLLAYQIFHAVAQQGSFARAAETLHLTPSAISHAVSGMEEEFGFPIFIRTKSGVHLTGGGQDLYPAVEHVLRSNESLMQTVAQLNGVQKGTVKLGSFSSVCIRWLPQIILSFKQKYPAIELEIYQGGYDDVIDWLKNGTVDLGFLSTSCTKELDILPLSRDRLVCAVPHGFKTRYGGYITVEEMRNQKFVIQSEGMDYDIQSFLKKYRLQVHSNCHVQDDQSNIAMVESGFGICILPQLVMETISSTVEVYPIRPEEERVIGLACLNKKDLSPAARQMLLHVQQLAPKL